VILADWDDILSRKYRYPITDLRCLTSQENGGDGAGNLTQLMNSKRLHLATVILQLETHLLRTRCRDYVTLRASSSKLRKHQK